MSLFVDVSVPRLQQMKHYILESVEISHYLRHHSEHTVGLSRADSVMHYVISDSS